MSETDFVNIFHKNETVSRPASYIGSFLVTGKGHADRAEIVRQKLEAARTYSQSKSILLLISLSGIKVCHETNERVYMAHALRRISYATCDPDNCQFAFLAREPKSQPNIQYCHAFATATSEAAEELNTIIGEAFHLAYARQQLAALSSSIPPSVQPSTQCTKQVENHNSTTQAKDNSLDNSSVCTSNLVKLCTSQMSHNGHISSQLPFIKKPLPSLPDEQLTEKSEPHDKKMHRQHKHKHHHHRHKVKDATTYTSLPSDTCLMVSEQQTTDNSNNLVSGAPLQTFVLSKPCSSHEPPIPPPRSQSSVLTSMPSPKLSTNPSVTLFNCSSFSTPVVQDHCAVEGLMKNLHSVKEEVGDFVDQRPVSTHLSENSYDIAEHRSCGGIPINSQLIPVKAESGHNISTVATTSSSTTGCSTATSGSVHIGSDGSESSLSRVQPSVCVPLSVCDKLGSNIQHSVAPLTSPCSTSHPSPPLRLSSVPDELYELSRASWYRPNIPREEALEMLSRQPAGSFVIRDSGSHANCYALSVRFGAIPTGSAHHPFQPSNSSALSAYPFSTTGISHFLIQRTKTGVKLKGLDKEWPSLSCLVLHLTVIPEMLPCALRLPKSTANPTFDPSDHTHLEEPSSVHFRSISDAAHHVVDNTSLDEALSRFPDEGEDYQRLSDFSSLMADLKLRSRSTRTHANRNQ